MIRRVCYVPMEYDDKGEPTVPDWGCEGEHDAVLAATEEWEQRRILCDSGSIIVAKVEETTDAPTAEEIAGINSVWGGEYQPGDEWRRWVGCVEVRLTTREIPKPA
jgi:hypothetical protein